MAFPLLFIAGGALVRALTPTIASYLAKQGIKKVATNGIKAALKKYGKPKTISSLSKAKDFKGSGASAASKELMKKFTIPKNKSLAIIKPKSKLINGKVITAATTVASGATLLAKDDKKGEASANTKKGKVDAGLQEALKKKARDAKNKKMNDIEKSTRGQKSKSTTTATTTKTKGSGKVGGGPKVIVTKEQLKKSGLSLRDYMNMLESKRLGRKISRDPRNDKKTVKKVEKKVEKKTPNYGGAQTIPKKTEKKVEKKKSKSFLGRVKEDFDKAVKETKRNFSDKRYFVNGVDSRKEKIKSKSNIKKKK